MKFIINSLPTFITLLNLICGFLAVVIGDIKIGLFLIMAGAFADVLDGLVARLLKVQSEMGKELDSLADIVTFGVAPAYLYFLVAPFDDALHIIPSSILLAGGGLRLAKFNTMPPSKYFRGLPIPAAAVFIVGFLFAILKDSEVAIAISNSSILYAIIPIALAILMNSNITMFSFKSLDKDIKTNFLPVMLVVLMIIFFLYDHKIAIPLTVICYILFSVLSGWIANKKVS